jgi:hypothetical protein
MCPFCFATLGLVVAGTVSTGGLAALAVKMSRKKNPAAGTNPNVNERSTENVNTNSRQPESSVAK